MSERKARTLRRGIAKAAEESMAGAALRNEQVTRDRVERLESVVLRTFMGRLVWLVLGR